MSHPFARSALFGASALLTLATAAHATEMKVEGAFDLKVVQQIAQPLGDANHLLVAKIEKGSHKSPGSPLDGSDVMASETIVIDKGNGPENGTISFVNDKGSITNEYHGMVKTVIADGKPMTTTSGVYKMIAGTGMFTGATGHGTYSATVTSQTDASGGYKGTLTLPKHVAER